MFKRIFIIILVITIVFQSFISNQVYANDSFSSIFGGDGSNALGFMVLTTALGITFVNQTDAISVYNELKENVPGLISSMVEIVKSSWLGMYDTVTSELITVKDNLYNYLVEKFGNVNEGINSIETYDGYLDGYGYQIYRLPSTSNPYGIDICVRIFGQSGTKETRTPVSYDVRFPETEVILFELISIGSNANVISYRVQGANMSKPVSSACQPNLNITPYESELDLPILDSITVYISSDAGVLDGNFDPDERDPLILPPPYFPGLENLLKERINPNGTKQKYFDGDIDDFLENAADNNTWSSVNDYLNTGTNTTTLTDTGTGLDVGEISSAPYPDTNIDVPDILTGIGTIGGLIQGITNWLSNLVDSIANIFAIPTDLTLNFDSLRLVDFKNKFPFSIPWDLYNAINVFARSPKTPDLTINFDTEYLTVNHVIDISRIQLPLMFARYTAIVFFIIFLIS